jgi:hypothetical protein
MPWRVEVKRIRDSDEGQIQMALAMGYVVTGALTTRRGRTYLRKTYVSAPAPKKKAIPVPAGGVGFDMSALSAALDDVAEAVAPVTTASADGWGGQDAHIALEVNDADVDALIAAMGGIGVTRGGKRKTRSQRRRRTRKN